MLHAALFLLILTERNAFTKFNLLYDRDVIASGNPEILQTVR